MRLLLDANLSPRVADGLRRAGFDVVHVVDLDLVSAPDDEIFERAAHDRAIVVTADSDFAALLALRRTRGPSVVHLRRVTGLSPEEHISLLTGALPAIADELERGAIASLSPDRLSVRELPLR